MTEPSPLRSFFVRLLRLCVTLLALELMARMVDRPSTPPQPEGRQFAGYDRESLSESASFLWSPAQGFDLTPGESSKLKVAILGDGMTTPTTLPPDRAWPELFRRLIDRAVGIPAVEMRVYSAPGYTAAQGEVLLERVLESFEPNVVIFQFGNGNEAEFALGGRRDSEWLAGSRPKSTFTHSSLVGLLLPFVDDALRPRPTPPGSVRQDRAEFESCLARMLARAREFGAIAALMEPVVTINYETKSAYEDIIEVYRLATAKVGGLYGAPIVNLRQAMMADSSAFLTTREGWSERGHRVAARQVFRTLAADSATLFTLRRWLDSARDDARRQAIAGSFALLHAIYDSTPATAPSSSAFEPLVAASRAEPAIRDAVSARMALVRWKATELESVPTLIESLELDSESALLGTIHAAALVLVGRGEEARSRLSSIAPDSDPRDLALSYVVRGISLFSSDATESSNAFRKSIEIDPCLGLGELWLAKLSYLNGDMEGGRLAFALAQRTLSSHTGTWNTYAVTRAEDDASIDANLRDEPTLFGFYQRDSLGRLLFQRSIESVVEENDAYLMLDRHLVARRLAPNSVGATDTAALEKEAANLSDDQLVALALNALLGADSELAHRLSTLALEKRVTPQARRVCAIVEFERKRPQQVIEHINAIDRWTEDPRLTTLMARSERDLGNLARAREILEAARKRWPTRGDIPALLAELDRLGSG